MCVVTAIEEPTTAFVRPDGREKVTGAGRYTADLTFTGQLHAAFRYADHPHARITRIDTTRARALPGVIAVVTHEDVPDVLYGGMVKDRRLFARDTVRFEGDIVAGVAATTEAIAREAAALVEVDLEPLPVVSDFEAALEARRDARPSRLGVVRGRRGARAPRQRPRVLDDREGRRRRGARRERRRRPRPLRHRPGAGRPDRAARDRRAVAGQPCDGLVVDAGAVRGPCRRRGNARDPRVGRSRDRPAPRRRLRREVRLPLRGARRRARARRRAPRQARVLAARGVRRGRPPARGHGDRARDRSAERRDDPRAARAARPRQRRVLRRGRVLRADGRNARARPVRARERRHRVVARLLEQPALLVDPRADRPAGLLGARAAHGRARRGARDGPGRASAAHARRGRLGDRDRAGARADRDEGDARARRRADRRRRRAPGERGDRRRLRLVAVLRRKRRAPTSG